MLLEVCFDADESWVMSVNAKMRVCPRPASLIQATRLFWDVFYLCMLMLASKTWNTLSYWSYFGTWSMTLALKMASSMCFSSNLMTHLMLLTTCWTSGGRLQLECSRNLATSILVSLYIFRSARECGRSWGEWVCRARGLRWMSTFLPSFCCFLTDVWLGLTPTKSDDRSVRSQHRTQNNMKSKTIIENTSSYLNWLS